MVYISVAPNHFSLKSLHIEQQHYSAKTDTRLTSIDIKTHTRHSVFCLVFFLFCFNIKFQQWYGC